MSSREDIQEAIAVFVNDQLDRELQYPEFEAVMDGFVPMPDFAGQTVNAVYTKINDQLKIVTCVFFNVEFDARGMIGAKWNVPLQSLADTASRGPDLGAGPIALACYSQCPIPIQQRNLWDPLMEPGRNSFVLLKRAAAANRLGLIFPDKEEPAKATLGVDTNSELKDKIEREYAKTMRTRLAHTLKEQRLRINTLKSKMELKIESLKREHQERVSHYRAEADEYRIQLTELKSVVDKLEKELEFKESKMTGVKEYYEHKLSAARLDGGAQIEALEEGFAHEMDERLAEATEALQQQIDMKDMELFYRQQQEDSLKEELEKLREEHDGLMEHGAKKILEPLAKAGISFVAFQPGLGQVTLPPEEVSEYVSDPLVYTAEKCGVDTDTYRKWLDHYQSPYCNAKDKDGEECGEGVKRVTNPRDFHDGETNRCEVHRQLGANLVAGRGQ